MFTFIHSQLHEHTHKMEVPITIYLSRVLLGFVEDWFDKGLSVEVLFCSKNDLRFQNSFLSLFLPWSEGNLTFSFLHLCITLHLVKFGYLLIIPGCLYVKRSSAWSPVLFSENSGNFKEENSLLAFLLWLQEQHLCWRWDSSESFTREAHFLSEAASDVFSKKYPNS